MTAITVIKNNHLGHEVWRYQGEVLSRTPDSVVLEAYFNAPDRVFDYVSFNRGDRMVEHFYSNRWYNIFELHEGADGPIKGWYCNFTRPASLGEDTIQADDLALDLFIAPDGSILLLDLEEFEALGLSAAEHAAVLRARDELTGLTARREPPFSLIIPQGLSIDDQAVP